MPLPTQNDVHADRPLTSFSVRYMNNAADYVADRAFPIVQVGNKSDSYYVFTASYWFRDEMQRRAPGNPYPFGGYGVSTDTYNCEQFALAKDIPDEIRANTDDPMNPDREAAEFLAQKALIRREKAFADAFMAASVWSTDNTTATNWDDSSGVPISDIQAARRTIKNASGMTANTLVMGKIVHDALVLNKQITDKVQYVRQALPREIAGILAAALDIERVLVSDVVYETAAEGGTSDLDPILDDDALLIYVPSAPSIYSAAAGLTMVWGGGGGMGEVERVRDDMNDRDVAKFKMAFDQKKVAADLGYFFSDIV